MQPKLTTPASHSFTPTATDLCQACAHGESCHLRQMPTTPVHDCNEYDDGTPAVAQDASVLLSIPQAPRPEPAPSKSAWAGLCINCDHREMCTLPHPAGGVWHCEEYQ